MVSSEIFVKSITPCLLKLKVTSAFCFPNGILDNVTVYIKHIHNIGILIHFNLII